MILNNKRQLAPYITTVFSSKTAIFLFKNCIIIETRIFLASSFA